MFRKSWEVLNVFLLLSSFSFSLSSFLFVSSTVELYLMETHKLTAKFTTSPVIHIRHYSQLISNRKTLILEWPRINLDQFLVGANRRKDQFLIFVFHWPVRPLRRTSFATCGSGCGELNAFANLSHSNASHAEFFYCSSSRAFSTVLHLRSLPPTSHGRSAEKKCPWN